MLALQAGEPGFYHQYSTRIILLSPLAGQPHHFLVNFPLKGKIKLPMMNNDLLELVLSLF